MSEIKNIPRLRFHHYQVEWETKLIGDVCEIGNGRDYKHLNEGDIPVYGTGGVMCYVDDFLHDGQSVGIGRKGSIDKPVLLDDKFWTVDTLFFTKSFLGVIPRFLFEIFNRIPWRIHNEGSGVPSLSQKTIKSLKISIPSLPEQQKIGDFLTSIDKRIELLENKKTLLETYKKGVMKKIFNQEIRFKDENGKGFPDWEEKRLGILLKHISSRNKSLNVELVLSVSNTLGFISQKEQFDKHRVASKDVSNYKIVRKNQFGYNPSRINVGSIALLKDYEVGIVSPMYVIFQTKEKLDSTYMEYLTQTHLFRHYVKVGCSGSVRDSLNFDEMEKFKFNIPYLNEQIKISEFLISIDNQLELLETQIEKSKTWKKGLLQKMFV